MWVKFVILIREWVIVWDFVRVVLMDINLLICICLIMRCVVLSMSWERLFKCWVF